MLAGRHRRGHRPSFPRTRESSVVRTKVAGSPRSRGRRAAAVHPSAPSCSRGGTAAVIARHSRERGNPVSFARKSLGPRVRGDDERRPSTRARLRAREGAPPRSSPVIPANAGIQCRSHESRWVPAFAGTTSGGQRRACRHRMPHSRCPIPGCLIPSSDRDANGQPLNVLSHHSLSAVSFFAKYP